MGGEDEAGCGYTVCGDGGFLLNDKCYRIVQTRKRVSYLDIARVCQGINGRPDASLHKNDKEFKALLLSKTFLPVLVGGFSVPHGTFQ